MSKIIIMTFISFILEALLSTFFPTDSLFNCCFIVMTFIILYHSLNKKDIVIQYAIITALIYDICLSNTWGINLFSFLLLFLIIKGLFFWLSYTIFNVLLVSLVVIGSYRIIVYVLLGLIGYLTFDGYILLKSIYSSIIINIIYVLILYTIDTILKKYKKNYI